MRPTLFFIPHQIGPLPVFGLGWVLLVWAVVVLVWGLRSWPDAARRRAFIQQLPFTLVLGAFVAWVLPALEQRDSDGQPLGLAIRGYGVFLLLGVLSAVALAAHQARQVGLAAEVVYNLGLWLLIGGIVGARAFYVIEYWKDFQRGSFWETAVAVLKFTEGGLVVYGAIVVGLAAGAVYVCRIRLPILAVADLIAPSLALGLAFGRLGCLMTGCCYGGTCELPMPCLQFPVGSPAYDRQLENGTIWGVTFKPHDRDGLEVVQVRAGSSAEQRGIRSGDRVRQYRVTPLQKVYQALTRHADLEIAAVVELHDGRQIVWTVADLPTKSVPVHPTQVYASINALFLTLLGWLLYPIRRRDGVVFATVFTLYPISRFLLEIIRDDEPGQFGTPLTISQWFCIATLLLVGLLWVKILAGPKRLTFGPPTKNGDPLRATPESNR